MIFLPYTKFIITLEGVDYFDAMKKSTSLAMTNLGKTVKYVLFNLFLYVRFLINIAIVIGIPLGMLYAASKLNIADSAWFQGLVISVLVILIALTAYINGIIEAFFISYRWKLYKQITLQK
jgi:hypothetical protein